MKCLGCQLANKEKKVFIIYEDDHITCILDHIPFNEGHVLILPKKHFCELEELEPDTAMAIMRSSIIVAKAIKTTYHPDGIVINQNGGIFNELNHYHMHVVPRYRHQSFASFYTDYNEDSPIATDDQQEQNTEEITRRDRKPIKVIR